MNDYRASLDRIKNASTKLFGPKGTKHVYTDGTRSWNGIKERPKDLARVADIDLDTYILARVLASEANPSDPPEVWLVIAEGVRNEALRKWNGSIYGNVCMRRTKEYAFTKDACGEQHGGWCSSARDATLKSLQAAREALEQKTNLGQGLVRWLDPGPFKSGKQGTRKLQPLETILAKWQGEGFKLVKVPGISDSTLYMFRPPGGSKADVATEANIGGRASLDSRDLDLLGGLIL